MAAMTSVANQEFFLNGQILISVDVRRWHLINKWSSKQGSTHITCNGSTYSRITYVVQNNNNNNNFIFVSKGLSISVNCGHLIYNTKTKLKTIFNSNIRAKIWPFMSLKIFLYNGLLPVSLSIHCKLSRFIMLSFKSPSALLII